MVILTYGSHVVSSSALSFWFVTVVLRMSRDFIFDHTCSVHGLGLRDFH